MNNSPASLAAEGSQWLPVVVLERKHDRPASDLGREAADGRRLLLRACAGQAIALVRVRWPPSLQVDAGLAWAELIDDGELALDEDTCMLSGGVSVEEGVDVSADHVNDIAEEITVLLPDVQGLGECAWTLVAGTLESGSAGRDESCEVAGGTDLAADSFVSNDNKLDKTPLSPGDDFSDLLLGTGDSVVFVNEYTQDDLQLDILIGASGSDVSERAAVCAVNTDSQESFGLDQGNVFLDFFS